MQNIPQNKTAKILAKIRYLKFETKKYNLNQKKYKEIIEKNLWIFIFIRII